MPRSTDIGTGARGSGKPVIDRWAIGADGHPHCPLDGLPIAGTAPELVAGAIAVNRAIAALCGRAEAVESAARLAVLDPPPEKLMAADAEGEDVEVPNQAYGAWRAAGQLLAEAAGDEDLHHLLRTRADVLLRDDAGVAEPAWALSLPLVPTLNPMAQTADWDGAVWTVRDLTAEETAVWPLRPPAVPATVTRVQLRLALAARGLLEMVDAAVSLSGDAEMVERWGAAAMERDSPHLAEMAAALGLTGSDIDDIFREAAEL